MREFVHLHTHSDYSLLDGASSITSLVGKAQEYEMSHLALTDHGNMFGALKFYKECRTGGIVPIIGSEFYLAPGSRLKKSVTDKEGRFSHLILLAANEVGYKNLLKLSSLGYAEGFYYKPRIDDDLLEQHKEGLICLTACLAGDIPGLILNGQDEAAERRALYYRELFGESRFYLELQDHGIPQQTQVNRALLEISTRTGIPVVATNDIHYTDKDDARAQDILICIGTNKKVTEGKRLKFAYPEFYFKSAEEMDRLFSEIPQALANTLQVAEMCQVEIPLPGPIFPDYEVPEGYTAESYLKKLAEEGLRDRYPNITREMTQRLDYELGVICSMGFAGYFLITWDYIHFAKLNGIPVGPGRGSGAGSLVAYSLKITDIDPLKYGLIFERFLNPERISLPDFDIDFCFERREEVIDYVTRKYGKDKVGQIITFGTLKAKAAIRDVARVLDYPYTEADRIAKLIPEGPKVTIAGALESNPELLELKEANEKNRELFEISQKLEGLARHASTHAAGIVIGREELTNYVPLYRDPKTGSISTQFTMDYLEDCGLVKMDFLGLKTLTIINKTCRMIQKREKDFDISKIKEDDLSAFSLLSEGKSTCVFQFESSGMKDILKRAKPGSIDDLSDLNALYRPGPMENIDQYIDCKTGKKAISYPLPQLEPILRETYGVITYQEQVMQIAREIAGYSLGQADILRKAMGKKKKEVMAEQKKKFIEGAEKKGYTKPVATQIFDLFVPFAGYGFNKCHSAPYSLLAYQTAYLKANYPAEFMAANLTSEIHNTDKLAQYMSETREMGIEILPPDINLSEKEFTVAEGKIVYGLCGVKNVGSAAVDIMLQERNRGGSFKSIHDFLERIDLKVANRKVVEALILTGVLDRFGQTRATLFHNLDRLLEMANRSKEHRAYGQESLFDIDQLHEMVKVDLQKMEEWPKMELLRFERQNLGFYFSGHPLDQFKKVIEEHTNLDLSRTDSYSGERTFTIVGVLKEVKEILTRTGKRMAFGALDDYVSSIELVIFPESFEKARELLEVDSIIAIRGKLDKSRGEPKLLVNEIMRPEELKAVEASSVHIRFTRDLGEETNLYELRDFIFDKPGECSLYLHLRGTDDREETIIRASPAISVSADQETIQKMMHYPNIAEVWRE
jgi:DNA polymerase-3 subunit alpha